MNNLTRRDALLLGGAGALGTSVLGACASRTGIAPVAVGSKNFTEELVLGEMYAALLAHALAEGADSAAIEQKLNLGGTQVAMEALQRGDIDLYPEYTGTALLTVLKEKPQGDAALDYARVKREYARRFDLVWLKPAPMNDTQALASTRAVAEKFKLRTLSDLAKAAPNLRLGAIPEFTKREDGLPGLQRAYGGFSFAQVRLFDIGLKYEALLRGQVDVVVAFGTDGQIAADNLTIFTDDKHFWPSYQVAPVVRAATLQRLPKIAPALDALAPLLTDDAMRKLNYAVDGAKREPADVALEFLSSHHLLT